MVDRRWWIDIGEKAYATLAGLVFDVFSMPSMSSECERAFSQGKKMTTDERFNLRPDIVEADECLKNWLRNELADGSKAWALGNAPQPERVGYQGAGRYNGDKRG